jgi:hypothetical protein
MSSIVTPGDPGTQAPVSDSPVTNDGLNRPLIERIITQLIDHPEQHDQLVWGARKGDCGTSHCVAGWAVAFAPEVELNWRSEDDFTSLWDVTMPDGRRLTTADAAQEILGLDRPQAEKLFYTFGGAEQMVGKLKTLLNEGVA